MPVAFTGKFASPQLVDMLSCALLAAAATCRARVLDAQIMGAVILGCICGLCAPLSREALLHGPGGAKLILQAMPEAALAGSLGGICSLVILTRFGYKIFFWLDAASIGLAGCLAACLGISELGIVGALVLGLICGLGPGLLRDMALGDTAMLIEQDWYGAAAALGIMLTILVLLWFPASAMPGINLPAGSIAAGAMLVLLVRFFRRSAGND